MGIVSGMGIIPDSFANLFRESLSEVPLLINRNKNNSYWYIGHLMSLLLTSKETGGKYALLRATERRGFEPPPHTHKGR